MLEQPGYTKSRVCGWQPPNRSMDFGIEQSKLPEQMSGPKLVGLQQSRPVSFNSRPYLITYELENIYSMPLGLGCGPKEKRHPKEK
jgi:hypothetical protein